ncbi:helix-turn-helix domain-containing protein [Actibacterium ureilyticum]|uniref:helix-turn-helix domain-containing protein n=1 Tax=Actibacterium ureilyticum TaxID=1590614 RepID=UPI000BAAE2C2|nr:AraC family transcriptional regulator [Actibacterium ureilyticum]
MGFHPKMYAAVRGFDLAGPLCNLVFDGMTVDYWQVHAQTGASGRYVSMHPRVVVMMNGARLRLALDRQSAGQPAVACFIPAGVELWSRVDQPGDLAHLDIHITRPMLRSLSESAAAVAAPVFLTEIGPIASLAELLARECLAPHRDPDHAQRLAHLILLELLHEAPGATTLADTAPPDWIAAVRHHAETNLHDKLSVDTLAAVAGMSRTNFNLRFRAETGQSPYRWVLGLRCHQAQNLMRQGAVLAEIADICGFADQAHFNRVFKAQTGQTPKSWMIEHRADRPGR